MHHVTDIGLAEVQAEYGAVDGDISRLIMGEQLHVGGLQSTVLLAARAGIGAGMVGVDLCCCTGAGMRALVRFCAAERMIGVDATAQVVERGRQLCRDEGLEERISFLVGDACATDLPGEAADFAWGEDAWCYVEDKPALIVEEGYCDRVVWLRSPIGSRDRPAWTQTRREDCFASCAFRASSTSRTIAAYSRTPAFASRPRRTRVDSPGISSYTAT